MAPIKTVCIPEQFKFQGEKSRPVVVNFKGGTVTSDAGLSLIAELDLKRKITSRLAACFKDYRDINRIEHSVENLIAQRVYGLSMGYEDLNDHEELRQAKSQVASRKSQVQSVGACTHLEIARSHLRLATCFI